MITLKEALTKSSEELADIKEELKNRAKSSQLNAYIDFSSYGDGVPILIKDNIQVKGWSITSGSKILQGYIAPYNATVVENLLSNGLSPFGRANMDEFAMGSTTENSFYGVTKNPTMIEVELQVEALEEVLVQLGERLPYVLWGVIQVAQLDNQHHIVAV